MEKIIYARIVKIINDTLVIIDKGETHGVKLGMKFVIYDEGEDIKDPENGKSLGKFEIQKGTVVVKQTMPTLSLLETEERLVRKEHPLNELSRTLSGLSYSIERVKERLEIDPKSLNVILLKKKFVSVGDKVRSVLK